MTEEISDGSDTADMAEWIDQELAEQINTMVQRAVNHHEHALGRAVATLCFVVVSAANSADEDDEGKRTIVVDAMKFMVHLHNAGWRLVPPGQQHPAGHA